MANKIITNKTIIDTAPPVPNKRIIGGSNQRSNLRSVLETPTSWKYNHAPTSGLETENGAWWQNRAERYGVKLSGSGDMLYSRQAVQREALRNLDHRRNTNHSIEFGDSYHGGSNQMLNKNSIKQQNQVDPINNPELIGVFEHQLKQDLVKKIEINTQFIVRHVLITYTE